MIAGTANIALEKKYGTKTAYSKIILFNERDNEYSFKFASIEI